MSCDLFFYSELKEIDYKDLNWLPRYLPQTELDPKKDDDITFCFIKFCLEFSKPDHFISTFEKFNARSACVCIFFLIWETNICEFFRFVGSLSSLQLTQRFLKLRSLPAGEYVYFKNLYIFVVFIVMCIVGSIFFLNFCLLFQIFNWCFLVSFLFQIHLCSLDLFQFFANV